MRTHCSEVNPPMLGKCRNLRLLRKILVPDENWTTGHLNDATEISYTYTQHQKIVVKFFYFYLCVCKNCSPRTDVSFAGSMFTPKFSSS